MMSFTPDENRLASSRNPFIGTTDTLWSESGTTNMPFDWSSVSSFVAALVPQSDGSFKSLSGSVGANGQFEIPNYFWIAGYSPGNLSGECIGDNSLIDEPQEIAGPRSN
jgi:hypothetical protein